MAVRGSFCKITDFSSLFIDRLPLPDLLELLVRLSAPVGGRSRSSVSDGRHFGLLGILEEYTAISVGSSVDLTIVFGGDSDLGRVHRGRGLLGVETLLESLVASSLAFALMQLFQLKQFS